LGLGAPFLWAAAQGIRLMLGIGQWVAGLPGAVQTVASAPDFVLPIAFLGVIFCCLWRGPLRWVGLPLACAVLVWPRNAPPDLWIGDAGTQAAFVVDRTATVVRPGVRQFAVDVWSRRRGLAVEGRSQDGWTCTRFSCAPSRPGGAPVALWWGRRSPSLEEVAALCVAAPVVSLRAPIGSLPPACRGRLVLDGLDYQRGGAVEMWRDGPPSANQWRAVWVAQVRGDRPWSRTATSSRPE
jgi:competence protein ComEC